MFRVPGISTSLLLVLVIAAYATTSVSFQNTTVIQARPGQWFDYVVIIMLENHSINYTYYNGRTNSCLGNCTYYTYLANRNGLAMGYTNDNINTSSVGDYLALTSGFGNPPIQCNNGPLATGCSFPIRNIVDSLESARLTWKAYMEGYPVSSGCYNPSTGGPNYYEPTHNPFLYYTDIQNNSARCSNIVMANSLNPQPRNAKLPYCWPIALDNDDLFLNDLNSPNGASNYMFLTPNTIDDNHDCNDVSVSNAWLQQTIPKILDSNLFRTKRAALLITFDEPYCTFNGCPHAASQIYTVWASNPSNPTTRIGFKSVIPYTHFSALRTIEDNWMLPPLMAGTDGVANNMREFF